MPVMPGITTSVNTTSKRLGAADQFFQRMGGVADQGRVVAEFGERIAGEFSDFGIVLDHEHRDAVAVDRRRFFRHDLQRPLVAGDARQIQREVLPLPTSLSTVTSPPDCFAKPNTCDRPSPVPWPTSLVVKNGSKMRPNWSGGMPLPVSSTDTAT